MELSSFGLFYESYSILSGKADSAIKNHMWWVMT